MAVRRSIIWIDVGGRTRQTSPTCQTTVATLQSDLLGHSNADFLTFWQGTAVDNIGPGPSNAQFPDVRDTAILTFSAPDGTLADLTLPAPKADIFMADGVTVLASAIADIIATATTELVTTSGVVVTSFIGGLRRGRTFNG